MLNIINYFEVETTSWAEKFFNLNTNKGENHLFSSTISNGTEIQLRRSDKSTDCKKSRNYFLKSSCPRNRLMCCRHKKPNIYFSSAGLS
jgi:hypothetical protein